MAMRVLIMSTAMVVETTIRAADTATAATGPIAPLFKISETIVVPGAVDRANVYEAFPALLRLEGDEVLITYKAGSGHTRDPGAPVDTLLLDLASGAVRAGQRFSPPKPLLFQCAEPVRFADGTVGLFLDTQRIGPEPRHYRAPMRWARSTDGGRTFGAPDVFPVVDGVGYGYPFEGLTVNDTTYLLVMTFGYLEGGRWSVDVLATTDSGQTWRRVRNLSEEFGLPGFNEGTLIQSDGGFLVASRSYDGHARLHELDHEFRLIRQVDLTNASPWVSGYIGRPRLLRHESEIYLLGRNWTQPLERPAEQTAANPLGFPREQQLCLFRLDVETLTPETCWILDNAEQAAVSDGYYAVAATTGATDGQQLHIITYKGIRGAPPDLVRLVFKWNELTP
jgi:hypothetical protein